MLAALSSRPLRLGLISAAVLGFAVAFSGCAPAGPAGAPSAGGEMPPLPMRLATATAQPLVERLVLVGSLAPNEVVEIRSEVDGEVLDFGFTEGAQVNRNQVLFRLDTRKLTAAVQEAEARHRLAEISFQRNRALLANNTISRQEFDEAEATYNASLATLLLAREQLADATISAPFAGQTTRRLVSPGQFVSRGQPLTSLVDASSLKIEFNVPERYVSQLALGQEVALTTVAFPGEAFAAEVSFISPQVDATSRTVPVLATLANPEGRLRPGMYGSLELTYQVRPTALLIPEAAVFLRMGSPAVVVVSAEGKGTFRPVQVGLRLAGQAEILSGLANGERVVVEGHQKVFADGTAIMDAALIPPPSMGPPPTGG